jgi:hypothetical protein
MRQWIKSHPKGYPDGVPITGECSPGCGDCCRILSLPLQGYPLVIADRMRVTLLTEPQDALRHFLEARGAQVEGRTVVVKLDAPNAVHIRSYGKSRRAMVVARSTCQHLTDEGKCDLFGSPQRPEACLTYPTMDHDLGLVPRCTYKLV